MRSILLQTYDKFILKRPVVTLFFTSVLVLFFAFHIPHFQLDASSDSLVLENDHDLHFHRTVTERYGSKDVLVVTYSTKDDLFAPASLTELQQLRDKLRQLEGVESVTTILDVPLVLTTNISLSHTRVEP